MKLFNTLTELGSFTMQLSSCRETLTSVKLLEGFENKPNLKALIHKLPPKYIDKWEEINLELKDAKKKPTLNNVIKFMQRIICARSDTSFGGEIMDEEYHNTFKTANKFQPEQKIKLLCTTSMEPEDQRVGDCEDSGVNSQIYVNSTVNHTPQGPRPNTSSPACRQLGWTCVCFGGDYTLFGCEDFRSRPGLFVTEYR